MRIRKMIKRHNKLAHRVIIPITILIVISITVFILNISRTIIESEIDVYEKMVSSLDHVINLQVDNFVDRVDYAFSDYETFKNIETEIDKEAIRLMLNILLEKNNGFINKIIIINDINDFSNYEIYGDTSEESKFYYEDMYKYYELHLERDKFTYYDKKMNRLYIASKIENSFMIIESDLNSLYASFESDIYSNNAKIGLLTTDGSIMTHSDETLIGKNVYELGFQTETLNEIFKSVSRNNKFRGDFKIKTPEDIKSEYNSFRYHFVPVNDDEYNLNWVIMFEIPTNVFQDKVISIARVIGFGGLLTILILIVSSRFIINGALKPIDQIVIAMNKAADGDLSVRTNVKSSNEIEVISLRLNEMLDHMEEDRDDLVNQKNEIVVLLDEVEELVQENNRVYYETIKTLAKTIDAKDAYTGGHCDRVTEVSTKIGLRLDLPSENIRVLSYSGMLHDIGKIGISEAIITKEGRLTDDEFDEIKKHPEMGFEILKNINFLKRSSEVVYRHHEKLDGTGYPNKLKGDKIDILSRIVAVADAFDAMSSDRSYRKALSKEICISELKRCSGTQFDETVVNTLIELLDDGEIVAFEA